MKSESCYVCEYAKREINRGVKEVRCSLHNRLVAYPNLGCVHCKNTRITNADRIRQMTDEELAGIMQGQCACCAYQLTGCTEKECKDGVYEWLKQEAECDDFGR